MDSPEVDIIIPHYGASDTLDRLCFNCLLTIRKFTRDFRLIFVDNGSRCHFDLRRVFEPNQPITYVRNSENTGFVKAVNQGFALSTAPYIVVMNNDTQAAPNWIQKLKQGFALDATVAAVGPKTTAKSWQGRTPWTGPPRVISTDGMLAFFCTMFRLDAVRAVGDLDESFGVGLGDDSDYCRRLHLAGYRLAFVPELIIPHHHRSTFHTVYGVKRVSEMQTEALERYKAKWSD